MRSKFEIKTQKELEKQGYFVDYKARPFRPPRNYHVDFFNIFDLIAYKPNEPIRWISVKGTMGVVKAHRQAVENFKMLSGNIKEIWTWRKLAANKTRFVPRQEIIA